MGQIIEAVLWDMDGTLADTGELHFQTWKLALADLGYTLSHQKFKETFGMNNHGILETLLGEPPSDELLTRVSDKKEGEYRRMLPGNVSLLPGVQEWLDWLAMHHIPQAIASSAPAENIEVFVDELHLRPYFATLVSGYDMPGKPDPGIFLLAAERLGVNHVACLVVEDSIAGVEAARRAGMSCVAVTTTNPPQALTQADIVVDNLTQLDPSEIINCGVH